MSVAVDSWAEPMTPVEVDHISLCKEALERAVAAVGRKDIESAVACLEKVEFEAGWARLVLTTEAVKHEDAHGR